MRPKHTPLLTTLASVSLLGAISSRLTALDARPAPSRMQTIDETARVVLKGNRHPLALSTYDRGPASPDLPLERMLLVLKRDAETESALERFLVDQ